MSNNSYTIKNISGGPFSALFDGKGAVLADQQTKTGVKVLSDQLKKAVAANQITATSVNDAGETDKDTVGGSYVVQAADDTANTKAIATGLTSIDVAVVQIIRANKNFANDAAISWSGGTLTVADGSTYNLTAGDKLNWVAVGNL